MDSKLEAHIDEIFQDVPKTDKMITMINRIKSKANKKYLETREQGYSSSVAFNEVNDWLVKAKVIVDEEAGKLSEEEIASAPKTAPAFEDNAFNSEESVIVEKDPDVASDPFSAQESTYEETAPEPTPEAPVEEAKPEKKKKEKAPKEKKEKAPKSSKGKSKKKKKIEDEEPDIVVPVKPVDKIGKIVGGVLVVVGAVVILLAALMIAGIL